MTKNAQQTIEELLNLAQTKIQVHNQDLYSRVLAGGSMALGESYMDGWWDSEPLDDFFYKILSAELDRKVVSKSLIWHVAKSKLLNAQNRTRSKKVAEEHYDLGNDFYSAMLDKRMQYTCGYWAEADNLDDAQEAKLDLICRKLGLNAKHTVLELGGGWGGFAKYAAEKYGCQVTMYNISAEQVKYARQNCQGLPIEIKQQDYRTAQGKFDRVVSIGMCEHVGYKNYGQFMSLQHRLLKDDGLIMLHTIGGLKSVTTTDPWIDKYIFPNGMLPSVKQLAGAMEKYFVLEDFHNIGPDYDKTLMAWFANFDKAWPNFKDQYGDRFYRMWKYYLLSCAGSFRARKNQLWQFVLSKQGVPGGYKTVR